MATKQKPLQEDAESVVLEELRSLDIHVQGMMQLRRDQDPGNDRPSTLTS